MRLMFLLLALCAAPRLAVAHAILMESTPAARASVAPGPMPVVLRFNSRIDAARSRLELRGGAAPVTLKLAQPGGPDMLETNVELAPGAWVLRWQVLAVDGHITRGDVPFTVRAP